MSTPTSEQPAAEPEPESEVPSRLRRIANWYDRRAERVRELRQFRSDFFSHSPRKRSPVTRAERMGLVYNWMSITFLVAAVVCSVAWQELVPKVLCTVVAIALSRLAIVCFRFHDSKQSEASFKAGMKYADQAREKAEQAAYQGEEVDFETEYVPPPRRQRIVDTDKPWQDEDPADGDD